MVDLLTPEAVRRALASLPGWSGDTSVIRRETPVAAARQEELVTRVMAVADAMDHHPEVTRGTDTVTFAISTHSAGGVTALDVELATRIDRVLSGQDTTGS